MSNKTIFEGTIDRIEEDQGVIILGTGEEINIPTEYLPFDADEGSVVKISLKVHNEGNISFKEEAKEMLDDLEESDYQEEMFYEE